MAAFLPQFDGAEPSTAIKPVVTNPCLAFAGLVDAVYNAIPTQDRIPDTKTFIGRVGHLTTNVASVSETAKCAYEADRLAIRIYQHPKHQWSVGVVAVVRGRFDAVVEGAFCYLTGVPIPRPPGQEGVRGESNRPQPTVCADATMPTGKDGQGYTILWVGSSDWMCDALRAKSSSSG